MASSCGSPDGLSVKRTDFEALRGRVLLAEAKSELRAGVFGWAIAEVELVGKPRNWEVRSLSWVRRRAAWSWRLLEALKECQQKQSRRRMPGTYGSPFASSLAASASVASMPSRNNSSEREMLPSCAEGSRLSEIALWRSRRESLMWSARRYS